jgi:hypothetical protein
MEIEDQMNENEEMENGNGEEVNGGEKELTIPNDGGLSPPAYTPMPSMGSGSGNGFLSSPNFPPLTAPVPVPGPVVVQGGAKTGAEVVKKFLNPEVRKAVEEEISISLATRFGPPRLGTIIRYFMDEGPDRLVEYKKDSAAFWKQAEMHNARAAEFERSWAKNQLDKSGYLSDGEKLKLNESQKKAEWERIMAFPTWDPLYFTDPINTANMFLFLMHFISEKSYTKTFEKAVGSVPEATPAQWYAGVKSLKGFITNNQEFKDRLRAILDDWPKHLRK